jgi:hypothetical protein
MRLRNKLHWVFICTVSWWHNFSMVNKTPKCNSTVTRLTMNSSSVCATGTVYTATNDNSPIIHVGCGYENYKALRNGDTDLLAGWPNWNPPVVSAAPTLGYTAATDRAGESAMYATPTPGQVFDPPTEAVCKFFLSSSCCQSIKLTRRKGDLE